MKAEEQSYANKILVCPLNSIVGDEECEVCPAEKPVFYNVGETYAKCLDCATVAKFVAGSDSHIVSAYKAVCKPEEEKPEIVLLPEIIAETLKEIVTPEILEPETILIEEVDTAPDRKDEVIVVTEVEESSASKIILIFVVILVIILVIMGIFCIVCK